VTGDILLSALENTVVHHVPMKTVFQSGGAPPQFSSHVHAFLDRVFVEGRRGSITWPSCSPEFISLDFFYGFLKFVVYREKLHLNELRDRIIRTAECVTIEMLVTTRPETEYRFDVCSGTYGAHIGICYARKKLCEVHCLKMYRFVQYTLWVKIYNIAI
jgi:hypothetical protein